MPSTATQASNSGIVTDGQGQRHIPESTRADGSTRKAIKIRPGYRPPEDVELYKNRTAEAFRNRSKGAGIPGADGLKDDKDATPSAAASAASNKNAKRREARKKAKAAEEGTTQPAAAGAAVAEAAAGAAAPPAGESPNATAQEANPELEKEKKVRNLKKKLKQARELEQKKEDGGSLLPEQIAKVIKINELIRELQALGFDTASDAKATDPAKEE